MGSAMTSWVLSFPRLIHIANAWTANIANTPIGECSLCTRERREQMFANVRVRLKMFAYGECREKLPSVSRPLDGVAQHSAGAGMD